MSRRPKYILAVAAVFIACASEGAHARAANPARGVMTRWWQSASAWASGVTSGLGVQAVHASSSADVCQPEIGFSPEGSGIALVLKAIASARQSIRVSAYAFTSREVARALVDARSRGVDVAVAVDARQNLTGPGRGAKRGRAEHARPRWNPGANDRGVRDPSRQDGDDRR